METKHYKHGFVVGIFIVIAIAILVITVLTLGGEKKSFTQKVYLKVSFTEINGLKEGNNVWFSGVKIGTVNSIVLKGASNVEVTLSIEKKSQPFIKKDAMAKIGSEGFLGNKLVIIYGGTSGEPEIEANGYLLEQKDSVTTADMMATLQSSTKNLSEITDNIKAISEKIRAGEGTIGKLVNDPSLGSTLQKTLNDFRAVAAKGKQSVANIENFTANMNKPNSSLNKLFADTALYDSVKNIIAQLQSITQTVNEFAGNMNDFANNLATVSESLYDTTSTAGMLLYDKQTADSLQVIIKNLISASKKLDEDLEAIRHNFLLKGYFKKGNTSQQK